MGETTRLREMAKHWGLDYRIGFDYNVWRGTYLSARQALGCTAGLALMALYVLALCFGNVGGLGPEAHMTFCTAFGLSAAVALNALAYLPRRLQAPLRSTGVAVGSSVAATVGALMLLMAPAAPGVALTAGLGALTGLGAAVATVHWGFLFSRLYIPDTASCAIAGTVVAALAYATLANLVPAPWGLAAAALFPLANAVVTMGIAKSWPTGIDMADPEAANDYKTFHDRRHQWPLFTYKVALPLACIGSVLRILLNHTQHNLVGNGGVVGALGLAVAATVCYVAVTFGIAGLRRRAQSYARLLSMIVPLVAIAALPATAVPASDAAAANMGTPAAVVVIGALTWTFMESMALEYSLAPVSIFGQGLGCLALGFLVATPLLELAPEGSPWFDIAGNLVCLLMVFGMLPAHPAADLSHSVGAQRPEGLQKQEATGAEKQEGARSQVGTGRPSAGAEPQATPETDGRPPTVAQATGAAAPSAVEPPRGKERFVRRCEAVAALYQLSPRELEVLVLLAKGRSMNHIKDELVVSEGTAKTHIRHVYRKLNVHSRHELVEIIESTDVGVG